MSNDSEMLQSLSVFMDQIDPDSDKYTLMQQAITKFQDFTQVVMKASPEELDNLNNKLQTQSQSTPLFEELGKVVRNFHNQIQNIEGDITERLQHLRTLDIESAKSRLLHIVEMTEKAANTTMDLSEKIQASLNEQSQEIEKVQNIISKVQREQDTHDLREVSESIQLMHSHFLSYQNDLTQILLAQDYQDLTGQVIGKITTTMEELQNELLTLLQRFQPENEVVVKKEELQGPLQENTKKRQNQDNVDALLANLGF